MTRRELDRFRKHLLNVYNGVLPECCATDADSNDPERKALWVVRQSTAEAISQLNDLIRGKRSQADKEAV